VNIDACAESADISPIRNKRLANRSASRPGLAVPMPMPDVSTHWTLELGAFLDFGPWDLELSLGCFIESGLWVCDTSKLELRISELVRHRPPGSPLNVAVQKKNVPSRGPASRFQMARPLDHIRGQASDRNPVVVLSGR
jgi:hypothetical protein